MHFLSSAQAATIADQPSPHEVAASEIVWSGRIVDMVEDHVVVVEGQEPVVRQYTRHPGAVAVVAMRGEAGAEEILMERQYRHPVQATCGRFPLACSTFLAKTRYSQPSVSWLRKPI